MWNMFAGAIRWADRRAEYRRAIHHLSQMSDHTLRDMGVDRANLRARVHGTDTQF